MNMNGPFFLVLCMIVLLFFGLIHGGIIMKKIMRSFFIIVLLGVTSLEAVRKTRKKKAPEYTLLIKSPRSYYSWISEYFFEQTTKNQSPDGSGNNSEFLKKLNAEEVDIEIVSNVPLEDDDIEHCFPSLSLKKNEDEGKYIVVWDIRSIEERMRIKRVVQALREIEEERKIKLS